ncbi:YbaB/EbfC family nucleoid-associated protein [Actinoplanes sp. NPDC051513]|uniref:YbaB/EbfC family nucleoid-associated protein n=1 Tax=Actinoplanes sp. NPDC051513 TaxID=3363908 RepID=UPI0037AA884D
MPNDIDAAEDWLDSWAAGVNEQAERSAALARRVAALTGSAQNRDGSIKVTVGSAGQVEALELDDRVQQLRGAELSRRILVVMRDAQASLARQVAGQVQATVGADTETGRAVIHSFETRFPDRDADNDAEDDRRGR